MASYNYFRILINFHYLLHLMSAYKTGFTTDHFYVLSNFVLGNSINCGSMLIHSQVIIFISSMSWYRWSIITDTKCHSKINYPIAFDRVLSKIRQLEEDHVVSKIALNTNKLVEGEFKVLLKRSKILLMQEDYAVTFAVITKKIYGSGCLRSVVRRFVLFFHRHWRWSSAISLTLYWLCA